LNDTESGEAKLKVVVVKGNMVQVIPFSNLPEGFIIQN